jgi:23S rRNA pseudouridine2605 synthase
MTGPVSLARALSKLGLCSRREGARWIEDGRVQVDGVIVRRPDHRIDLGQSDIRVDDVRVRENDKQRTVIVLNKPEGYITTRVDEGGRPTVYHLLGEVAQWVFPVGRLDRDTSGLLVMTNDHRLGQRLTDPGQHIPKTYHAEVRGLPGDDVLQALREGVVLEDGITRPARVRSLGASRAGTSWIEITLTEGRNRQVRRMFAALGHDVQALVRVRIGGLAVGDLAPGEWRHLDAADIVLLQQAG